MIFSRGSERRRDPLASGRMGRRVRSHRAGSQPDPAPPAGAPPEPAWLPEPADLPADSPADEVAEEVGPYDSSQAPKDGRDRLDLGALRVPMVAGVEIQLQAGPDGHVHQILLSYGASRLQLGAFAAPRTEGIWDEVRQNVRTGLASAGGKPQEVDGDYGVELVGRVKDGAGYTDVRHVGIDGPRWFVHAVFLGAAAVTPDRAGPLREVLHGLVVDRGSEARPVGEVLPLRLPPEAAAQLADAARRSPVDRQAT